MKNYITTHNLDEFGNEVCKLLYENYYKCITNKGEFNIALTGGNTPKIIYNHLIKFYKEKIDWKLINIYYVDERFVNINHKENNYYNSKLYLLDSIKNIKSVNNIPILESPEISADYYNNVVKEINIDFCLLGMGEDGHVGSIFPNSKSININDRLVISTKKKYNGYHRISFTIKKINHCNFKILIINNNIKKLDILKSDDLQYPINLISDLNIISIFK
tara:strand:- start:1 stop:657 length:657 start_codon:yes stop_codon:yes gene_type:complete